ncbi:hypothetical protein [Marinobacter caseinilyticus]|uniref:COG1470 family protein n=1 Tax=Marinobacter caseinilyticus TaxID=2692195 RepID=UPI001407E49A|nr:hypothetical protein [Marinobacter caseinilyticus]
MKGTHSGEPGSDWHLTDGPYSFSGAPFECRGALTLVNNSDHKIKVRALATRPPQRYRKDSKPLAPTRMVLAARIAPHGESRTMAALQLPSSTPPGHYQTTVICGKQKTPVNVEVLAHQELMIEPTHLRLQGVSGQTLRCNITLSNLGNVPVDIGDVGMVWLREYDWIGRTLVYSLRETGPDESYEDFANRLLHDFRKQLIAPARIQFTPAIEASLSAGEAIERTLSLMLPAGLKKGRRYLGFIKINDDRVWLELYCTGSGRAIQAKRQP